MVNKRLFAILLVAVLMASVSFVSGASDGSGNSENQGFFESIFGGPTGEQVRNVDSNVGQNSNNNGFLGDIFDNGLFGRGSNKAGQDQGNNQNNNQQPPQETLGGEGERGRERGREGGREGSSGECCEVDNKLQGISSTGSCTNSNNPPRSALKNCSAYQTFFDPTKNTFVKETYNNKGCVVRESYKFSSGTPPNITQCEKSIGSYVAICQPGNYNKTFIRKRWDATCLRQKFNQYNGTQYVTGPKTQEICGAQVGDPLDYSVSCSSGNPLGDSHGNYRSKTNAYQASDIRKCQSPTGGYQANCPLNGGPSGGGNPGSPGGPGSGPNSGCNNTDVQKGQKDYPILSNGSESPVPEGEFKERGNTSNSQTSKQDECTDSGELREFYCTSNGVQEIEVDCEQVAGQGYVCKNGECVSQRGR